MPTDSPGAVLVVAPPVHRYVYGAVPALVFAIAEPLLLPQVALIAEVVTTKGAGWLILTDAVAVHELASVIVTE